MLIHTPSPGSPPLSGVALAFLSLFFFFFSFLDNLGAAAGVSSLSLSLSRLRCVEKQLTKVTLWAVTDKPSSVSHKAEVTKYPK